MTRRNYLMIGAGVVFFIVLSAAINKKINSKLQAGAPVQHQAANDLLTTQGEVLLVDPELRAEIKPAQRHDLNPDDAAKFGIMEQKIESQSANLWETNVQKTLVSSGAIDEMEKSGAFSSAGLTKRDIDRKIKQLDERIKEQQRIIQADPSVDEARAKLQNLFMMKATLSALAGKVSAASSAK